MTEASIDRLWPGHPSSNGEADHHRAPERLQILLVEDNPGDADLVREALAGVDRPGFELTLAERLDEAVAWLEQASVDAVLLDLNLPDSRGLDTLRKVKEATAGAAVVILTGLIDEGLALDAMRHGAQDYLRKDDLTRSESALTRVLLYAVERSRLQQEVARGHADFAALIEQNSDGILAVDADGVVRYANAAAAALLGGPPRELVGRDLGLPAIGARWAEVELRGPDGEVRTAEMRSTRIHWNAEQAQLVVLHDVTDRKRAEEALRRSEGRYRTLFETMAQGVVYQAADGAILSANPAAERILGLSLEQMQGRTSADPRWRTVREDGSDLPGDEHASMQALATGRPVLGMTMGVYNPTDDEHRWIQVDAIPQFRPREDQPSQVYATFVDVTEQRRTSERIRLLNRLLRTTSEINQMIVRERDRQRVVEEACRIAVEHGEFVAACAARLEDGAGGQPRVTACAGGAEGCAGCAARGGDAIDRGCGPLWSALESGEPVFVDDISAEARFPTWREGVLERGFHSAAALPVREAGRVTGGFVVYSDQPGILGPEIVDLLGEVAADIGFALETIAGQEARCLAEERLRESERRFRLLFERNLAGVYRTALDGEILECNDAFAHVFGYAGRDDLIGRRTVETYQSVSERDAFLTALQEHRELRGYENLGRRKDGSPVHVLENASLVEDQDGTVSIEGSVIDITEHIRTQEQLLQAQKLEAVGRLAGGVAHDFNNLLQAGVGLAEILRGASGDEHEVREAAGELDALFQRGASLTRQMLLFARQETSARRPLDLGEVVRDVSGMLRRLLKETVDLRLDLADGALDVSADRGQLEQVIVNLALNAADAMPDGGRIVLRTGSAGGRRAWFEVEDDGTGIPEEIRRRLFEPFFTTKGPGKGTGLGLSVVHGIVTDHGGEITVDTEEERGTTFRVLLPAAAAREQQRVEADQPAPPEAVAAGQRALVVEDQSAVRRVLERMLERLGYAVTGVESAEDAVGLPADVAFDVLLSDVVLPGISGPELAAQLRERWPGLRVVMMSGYSEDEVLRQDALSGRVHFLSKPFTMPGLAEVMAKAMEGNGTGG